MVAMNNKLKWLIASLPLAYAYVTVFHPLLRPFVVGTYVNVLVILFAIASAYVATVRLNVELGATLAFTALVFAFGLGITRVLNASVLPSPGTWGGFALYAVMGVLAIVLSAKVVAHLRGRSSRLG